MKRMCLLLFLSYSFLYTAPRRTSHLVKSLFRNQQLTKEQEEMRDEAALTYTLGALFNIVKIFINPHDQNNVRENAGSMIDNIYSAVQTITKKPLFYRQRIFVHNFLNRSRNRKYYLRFH